MSTKPVYHSTFEKLTPLLDRFVALHEAPPGKRLSPRSLQKRAEELRLVANEIIAVWTEAKEDET